MSRNQNDFISRMLDQGNYFDLRMKASGRFTYQRVKKDSGLIVQELKGPNLLVNNFFDDMLNSSGTAYTVRGFIVGSGTAAPNESQTTLGAYIGGGNSAQAAWLTVNSSVSPRSITQGMRFRANGSSIPGNLTEIAMYWSSDGSSSPVAPSKSVRIFNRARITDELGVPVTLQIQADEFLDVVYELTIYAFDGITGTMSINLLGTPTNFDYEIRPVCMNSPSYWNVPSIAGGGGVSSRLSGTFQSSSTSGESTATNYDTFEDPSSSGTPNGIANGANAGIFTSETYGSYTPGSKTRLQTLRLPLNNGNITPGIRSFLLKTGNGATPIMTHRMMLSANFTKIATQVFDLPIQITMGNA